MKFRAHLINAAVVAVSFPASMVNAAPLEEVVVTAQKRQQSINDVGITMNAFAASQLENFGVTKADDLEALVPGLTVTNSQPAGAPVYTIRGVGFNDFTTSASSTVGIYTDTTNIPYPIMTRGVLFDIERIEVLKGPQGDLYGRNTTAGTINFISNKPTDEFEAGIQGGYDNFETLDLEGYVSGPLTERVNGRLAARRITSDGWQESVSRPGEAPLGERDELALRGILDITLGSNVTALVTGRYLKDKSETVAATATAIGGFFDQSSLPDSFNAESADWSENHRPQNDNETAALAVNLTWDFEKLQLISLTTYDDFSRDRARFDTSGANYEDASITNSTDIQVFSQEFRVESTMDSGLYWTAGLYYNDDRIEEQYLMEFRDSFGLTGESRYEQDTKSVALYGHVEIPLGDAFQLTLGGRYTEEERSWAGCTYDTGDGLMAGFYNFFVTPVFLAPQGFDPTPVPQGGCAVFNDVPGTSNFGEYTPFSDTLDTEQTMGKVSLNWNLNENVLLFATVSTGFKSGGYNGAIALSHQQLQPYNKETLTSYELGMKSTLLDGSIQLNAALFMYDYEDKQELTTFIAPVGGVVGFDNVPESTVQGAELEMQWAVTEGLRWDFGLAYLDTEIDEWSARCPAGLLGAPVVLPEGCPAESSYGSVLFYDASGTSLNNSPELQLTSTLSYSFNLAQGLQGTIASDVSYKEDNIGSIDAPTSAAKEIPFSGYLPDYTLLNARFTVAAADGNWSATLWGRNITDEYYWHSTGSSNSTSTRINGMPKTYGVTLKKRW
jgi:iron complex outermembrane recepter protein